MISRDGEVDAARLEDEGGALEPRADELEAVLAGPDATPGGDELFSAVSQ